MEKQTACQGHFMRPIARVTTDFPSKFGIPRQSGLVPSLKSTLIFEPEYRNPDALKGLEEFSHLWLIWEFSESIQDTWSPTVRPPRLGGNVRKGVFATRSPFRPNPLGLSCVKLEKILWDAPNGPLLLLSGADLMDQTPVYDIKPYIPFSDSHPEAAGGFADTHRDDRLRVEFKEPLKSLVPEEHLEALIEVLALDPRPAYQKDPTRIYGFPFAGMEIRFSVRDGVLTVVNVEFTKA